MDKIVAVGEQVGDLEERTLMFMKAVRSPSDLLRMAALISTDSDGADCERHGCGFPSSYMEEGTGSDLL